MHRLLLLALLVPSVASAEEDAFAPCDPEPLLIHPPPSSWGVGGGRCLPLPADLFEFCDAPDLRSEARLVTGDLTGGTVANPVDVPSELFWLPTGAFDLPLASLCATGDDPPEPLFVVVTPPEWEPREEGLLLEGDPDAGVLPVPVYVGPVPPPQAPNLDLRRLRDDEVLINGSPVLGMHLGFAATLQAGADAQSIVHVVRTDEDGVPTRAADLVDASPAEWREALRQNGDESLRASRAGVDSSLRPRIEGVFRAHSFDVTCWVAVVEAGDTSWSEPSEVQCAEPVDAPDGEVGPGCDGCSNARGTPAPWALLALLAIPRRGRRTRPRT